MTFRSAIPDFQLANPIYAAARVTFYIANAQGTATATLAALYADATGAQTVANPQTLDSEGKFSAPVYINEPVVASVVGPNVSSHSTGAINAYGTWRGNWAASTIYYATDLVQEPTNGETYVVVDHHTSSASILTDIAAGHLVLVFDPHGLAVSGANSAIKAPCRLATTGNITLSGLQTIDGVAGAAGDRVVVWQQTIATQNGIYLAASGNWTRALDFDGALDIVKGTRVYVHSGASFQRTVFAVTTANPITVGTSEIVFEIDGVWPYPLKTASSTTYAITAADFSRTIASAHGTDAQIINLPLPTPVINGNAVRCYKSGNGPYTINAAAGGKIFWGEQQLNSIVLKSTFDLVELYCNGGTGGLLLWHVTFASPGVFSANNIFQYTPYHGSVSVGAPANGTQLTQPNSYAIQGTNGNGILIKDASTGGWGIHSIDSIIVDTRNCYLNGAAGTDLTTAGNKDKLYYIYARLLNGAAGIDHSLTAQGFDSDGRRVLVKSGDNTRTFLGLFYNKDGSLLFDTGRFVIHGWFQSNQFYTQLPAVAAGSSQPSYTTASTSPVEITTNVILRLVADAASCPMVVAEAWAFNSNAGETLFMQIRAFDRAGTLIGASGLAKAGAAAADLPVHLGCSFGFPNAEEYFEYKVYGWVSGGTGTFAPQISMFARQ